MELGFTTVDMVAILDISQSMHWRFREFGMNMVFYIITVWFWLMIMYTTTPSTNWPFEWNIQPIVITFYIKPRAIMCLLYVQM